MKKIFYYTLFFTGAFCAINACSNGPYTANPSSNANNSVNPLKPLTSSQFTWGGESPVSGDINGTHWRADTAYFGTDSSGASYVTGIKYSDGSRMTFHLLIYKIESSTLYNLSYHVYDHYAGYMDSTSTGGQLALSYLGNSGEINIC